MYVIMIALTSESCFLGRPRYFSKNSLLGLGEASPPSFPAASIEFRTPPSRRDSQPFFPIDGDVQRTEVVTPPPVPYAWRFYVRWAFSSSKPSFPYQQLGPLCLCRSFSTLCPLRHLHPSLYPLESFCRSRLRQFRLPLQYATL